MSFDIILGIIFVGSSFWLWYFVSQRLPRLVSIPDHVVTERLEAHSGKFRLFLLNFRVFWHKGEHWELLRSFIAKTLQKFHIVLLRLDNGVVALQKKLKQNENGGGNGNASSEDIEPGQVIASSHTIRLVKEIRPREMR